MSKVLRMTITLPVAQDALGRWCEEHGAAINMLCMLGTWHVSVRWGRLISCSDDTGTHRETHEVTRYHSDPTQAFANAVAEAMRQTRGTLAVIKQEKP